MPCAVNFLNKAGRNVTDNINAFVPGSDCRVTGRAAGPLNGLTFVAKDLFDVAGYVTGGGNPAWPTGRPVPAKHAWAVQTLLDAGADLIGKTITDEVSMGILGENAFHGTPLNSAAPDCVPGGSSSGTAAAVAAGLADTGLGTDTGGSVRVPASFCGLFGIRPSHGRLPLDGMLPQAPSSDTAGWFARKADTFRRVSEVMLAEDLPDNPLSTLVIATDAFGFAEDATREALQPALEALAGLAENVSHDIMAPPGLSIWGRAQRTLQPAEAWQTFQDWIETRNPPMAFNVARGFIAGSMMAESDKQWAALMRREARARLRHLLPPGTVLAMPTTPFPAPKKNLPLPEQNHVREMLLCLCAHGGLAGLPQISIPAANVAGAPVGLSLVAADGADAWAIRLAMRLAEKIL